MSNGKPPRLDESPLNNPFMWWLLRLRPSRTVEILRRHLGLRRVPSSEMERVSWKVLIENCPPGEVAEVLLQRLDPASGGRLLDLAVREVQTLLRHLECHARARVESLGLPETETADRQALFLAGTVLEGCDELAAAAAVYSLAHDERAGRQDAAARLERLVLRVKLGKTLYRRDRQETGNLARCLALGRGTLAQLESLRRAGSLPADAVRPIELELHGWLGTEGGEEEERRADRGDRGGSDFDPGGF